MPAHGNHLYTSFPAGKGTYSGRYLSGNTLDIYGSNGRGWMNFNGGEAYPAGQNLGGSAAHNHGNTSASSPGTNSKLSSSQSILNPYITVYIWKRIS